MEPGEFRNEIFLNLNILTRPAGGDKDKTSKSKSVDNKKLKNEKINTMRESKKLHKIIQIYTKILDKNNQKNEQIFKKQ